MPISLSGPRAVCDSAQRARALTHGLTRSTHERPGIVMRPANFAAERTGTPPANRGRAPRHALLAISPLAGTAEHPDRSHRVLLATGTTAGTNPRRLPGRLAVP